MKIPKTTEEKAYIEFRFNRQGKLLELRTTSNVWKYGFDSTDGSCGSTCLPKDLDKSIRAFKKRKVGRINKEIKDLQKQLKKYV